MLRYELKKVFSRTGNKIALLLLLALVCLTCFFALDVSWVDENGDSHSGPAAIARLRAAQKEWAGVLDEEAIRRVIEENLRIQSLPEAQSNNVQDSNITYGRGQGIQELRYLLNCFFAEGFRSNDYYRMDSLMPQDAPQCYPNRIRLLREWLDEEAKDQFSEREKAFLIERYESLETPLYYDYALGWTQLLEYAPTVVMIGMLVLGYLVAGIFSNEFTWKSDAVFYSSLYGRDRAVKAKLWAGFCLVTGAYMATFLLYSVIVLGFLGTDGWNMAVQATDNGWKCFYHITLWQEFLLTALGGYIGCLFIAFLCMLVSARTRSAVLAVMLPFVLIFIPSFLSNIPSDTVRKVIGLLPDQLLQTGTALNLFNLYSVGGRTVGAVPILLTVYTLLTVCLWPVIYQVYRRKQIR
ncbi:MAG: ABC transporter permease [bacterium]|nr:ABC transporter permease [bacterium]MCM1376529.1 ABC transporter permease [Muribaculum sp.]